MTELNLDQLETLARAATPGPWARDPQDSVRMQVIAHGNEVIVYHRKHERQEDARVVPNFAYIAAASPSVILQLTAELRKTRDERDAALAQSAALADSLQYCAVDDPMAVDPSGAFDADSANEWKKMRAREALERAGRQRQGDNNG